MAHYEALLGINTTHDFIIPGDFYSAIADVIDFDEDSPRVELYSSEILYLFEYCRVTKVSGTSSPYVCLEWARIRIPRAIISLLGDYKRKLCV